MKKRIFSLLMAVVMLVTLGTLAVSAEDAVVEDVPVEDVPVEDVPVATGINITKPNLPEYYVTTKVTNNFPTAANTIISGSSVADPGIEVTPGEYAKVDGDFALALEDGNATLTLGENTTGYDLFRIMIKSTALSGANYLAVHVDTTGLTGPEGFNFHINNMYTAYNLAEGAVYYFLPDATEENPNPKRVTRRVGDTSFEGLVLLPNEKGTIYLPESSFAPVNSKYVEFDAYIESWTVTHGTRENAALYIENKLELSGAVAGDSIVFSNLQWVKEDSVSLNLGYNAEYTTNDFASTETGMFNFNSYDTSTGWGNWISPEIGAPMNESFEALKFDLDYSEFTGSECNVRLWYIFNYTVDEVTNGHSYRVTGSFYLIWENGKVQEIEVNSNWEGGTIGLPSGFKGTVVIPFSSFTDTRGDGLMFLPNAEYPKLQMQFYRPISGASYASIDNFGFLTTYNATDLVSARAQIMEEAFEETTKTVDVNGDGIVDALDLVRLKKIVSWAA